jgi:hypothetical protein
MKTPSATAKLKELYLHHMADTSPLPEHAWPQFGTRYGRLKPERRIKKQIRDMIVWCGHFAKIIENTGQYMPGQTEVNVMGKPVVTRKAHFRYSANVAGQADVEAVIGGKAYAIELKRIYKKGRDRQSAAQKRYQEDFERGGGVYTIVHDLQDFYDKFKDIL